MIKIAQTAGFCKGVQRAVDQALELAEKYGKVYTIGELVHNENAVEFLKSKGVIPIKDEEISKLDKSCCLLVRAHGIPVETERELIADGYKVFDATCPIVKKVHKIISDCLKRGEYIVYVGDKNHDEVIGAKSYGGNNIIVVDDVNEQLLDSFGDKIVNFVFQTTVLTEKFEKIKRIIENKSKLNGKSFGFFNTICYTTLARQNEAYKLAETSDAVIVVGSNTSANTKRIFQVAKKINDNVFFVENLSDASKINCNQYECISIVAGASTPPWLVQEVNKLMSETQNKAQEIEVNKEATLQKEASTATPVEKEITMKDVMEGIGSNKAIGYTDYKPGKRYKCTVIFADESGIKVAIGGKKDGFIDKQEANIDGNYNANDYKPNDIFDAVIIKVDKDFVQLSKKRIDEIIAEDAEAEKALSSGEFSLMMTEVVKGGLRGKLGRYTVFVPASQIKMGYVKNLEDYKGKTLRLALLPAKEKEVAEGEDAKETTKKSRYLFASQRIILEKEKKDKEDLFWDNIHVHDIVTGKVKRFTEFGAFVSVRGFDCLAHISELSWNKITDPSTVLTIGESYDFVVLKLDRETGKISLGFKQLQKKPYEIAAETYPVGTIINGTVERIFPYGAFISISDGVDGLVHVSQISHKWIKDANEALKVGEEVQAKIIGFEDNRITLSIKELLPEPEVEENAEVEENEVSEEKAKKPSRVKKFEQKFADSNTSDVRRERRSSKKDNSNEPKEWVSGSSNATLGDLFKSLNLNLDENKDEE